MTIVDLRGREHEPAVLELLAAAQIHRTPEDALLRAPSIAEEYARSDALQLWGCQVQEAIVGVVGVASDNTESGVIRDLAVAPDKRRQGVGLALISFLRSEAGFAALAGVTLAIATPFYERCGFEIVDDGLMPGGETRCRFVWRKS